MGKRGSKPSFIDIACPNESCRDYGKIRKRKYGG